jgi:thiazole synthase
MLSLYGTALSSRLLLGTARYPSTEIMAEAVRSSGCEVVTVALRREMTGGNAGAAFYELIRSLGVRVLPNTAGCYTVRDAVLTAHMTREVFGTDWIKLEVLGNRETLQPDTFGLVEAAKELTAEGFKVFPYTTDDLIVAERLLAAGCEVLMPWCAPIGSGAGPRTPWTLKALRSALPDVPLIVDAGIGRPSHAATVMELGYDAILLNTAVAGSGDPVAMAEAFAATIAAGRQAFEAGTMEPRERAVPSTPVAGQAVFA